MRYYNVYLYSQCPLEQNTESYPSYWVWKVEKCLKTESVPSGALRMSLNELMVYKQSKKIDYNTWVNTKVEASTVVNKKVKKALNGAADLMSKFCAENIVLGITQAGKTKLIADTLKDVFYYTQTGSLYECLTALDAIVVTPEMSPFLTTQKINDLKSKVLDLLGTL